MKVITLLENRSISKDYKCKHGLSFYIETAKHKILFDTGKDDSFVFNANKLGVDLRDVDLAIISHGHYDHGGGLGAFLKINSKATIYMGMGAFDKHIVKLLGMINYSIGLDKKNMKNDRIVFVNGLLKLDSELTLFSEVYGKKLAPKGNNKLLKEQNNGVVMKDDFNHEINLLVNEKDKYVLFCGCAHKGIINIIEKAKEIANTDLYTVISGFHLMGMKNNDPSTMSFLIKLAEELENNNVKSYYTCHCTGEQAFNFLNERISNINELRTGMSIEID